MRTDRLSRIRDRFRRDPDPPAAAPGNGKVIRFGMYATVTAVASVAAVQSFSHIYWLARMHHQDRQDSSLMPLSVDGLIVAASLVMLHETRAGRRIPGLARFALWLGIAVTIAANVAAGLPYGAVGGLISSWPAVSFVIAVEILMGLIRRVRSAPATPPAEGQPSALPPVAETVTLAAQEQQQPEGLPALLPVAPVAAPVNGTQKRATATARPPRKSIGPRSVFAAELAAGVLPSKRDIQKRMHVGWDKVDAIRADLEQAVGERMAMAGNGNGAH